MPDNRQLVGEVIYDETGKLSPSLICKNCVQSGNHGYWCYRHDRGTAPNGTCEDIQVEQDMNGE